MTSDLRLSATALTIFQAAEKGQTRLVISAIVIAEMYFADKKRGLFQDFAQTYQGIKSKKYFRFVDLKPDVVLNFTRDAAVPEMHDRIIAGLARNLNAPLITADSLIISAGIVRIVW